LVVFGDSKLRSSAAESAATESATSTALESATTTALESAAGESAASAAGSKLTLTGILATKNVETVDDVQNNVRVDGIVFNIATLHSGDVAAVAAQILQDVVELY